MFELGSTDQLLDFALESLDVPADLQTRARAVYDDLGAWVIEHDSAAGRREPSFFPQGSAALGTTTMNNGDWDIDAVYERHISRSSTTQETLTAQAGEVLLGFQAEQRRHGKPVPQIKERNRCWRLIYDGFHIDALPAIPEDLDDDDSTRLLISDKEQRDWIITDPKEYVAWFINRMGDVFVTERQAIAKESGRAIEDVPVWEVKTVLQRVVQFVRRHRDLFYGDDRGDLSPASILVTTLVARCYEGQRSITDALRSVATHLPAHVLEKDGELWVPNPTDDHLPEYDRENLARAMVGDPPRATKFRLWCQNLRADIGRTEQARGVQLNETIAESVGEEPTREAVRKIALLRTELRDAGGLRLSPRTGKLGAIGAIVPRHTFDGTPSH